MAKQKAKEFVLTEEIKAKLPSYKDRWLNLAVSTSKMDREWLKKSIPAFYKHYGISKAPAIEFCDSPRDLYNRFLENGEGNDVTKFKKSHWNKQKFVGREMTEKYLKGIWGPILDAVCRNLWEQCWQAVGRIQRDQLREEKLLPEKEENRAFYSNQLEMAWCSFYEACYTEFDIEEMRNHIKPILDVTSYVGTALFTDKICYVAERPLHITKDEQGRLHNDKVAAILYKDGYGSHVIHGIRTTKQVVEAPETMTIEQIDKEPNAELKRIMVERFGQGRFILEGNAQLVAQDEWGALYRREIPGDEPLIMVKVTNSTMEPDGTFKDYFLRVDPQCRPLFPDNKKGAPQEMAPLNGIAASFGLTGAEYLPQVQS